MQFVHAEFGYNLVKAIREGNPDETKKWIIEHIKSIKLSLED